MKKTVKTVLIFACFIGAYMIAYAETRPFAFVTPDGGALTGMKSISTSSVDVVWNDPYSNSYAFYFSGTTNSSGYGIDKSFNTRHASNSFGVTSVPIGTNVNGRVQYAFLLDGSNYLTIAADGPLPEATNFLNGVTSLVCCAWIYMTNAGTWENDQGVCITTYDNDNEQSIGLRMTGSGERCAAFKKRASVRVDSDNGQPTSTWLFVYAQWTGGSVYPNLGISINGSNMKYSIQVDPAAIASQDMYLHIGWDAYSLRWPAGGNRKFMGYITGVMIITNVIPPLSYCTNLYTNTFMPNGNILY